MSAGKSILRKLLLVRQDVQKMSKDGHNDFHKYSYLSETQITLKIKQLLDKHGVVFLQNTEITATHMGAKSILTEVRVHWKFYDVETTEFVEGHMDGQGLDKGDKGIWKATTGAIKYIFMKNFLIPTGDDPEGDVVADKIAAKAAVPVPPVMYTKQCTACGVSFNTKYPNVTTCYPCKQTARNITPVKTAAVAPAPPPVKPNVT